MKNKEEDFLFVYRAPIFLTISTVFLSAFVFFLTMVITKSLYHGSLGGSGTFLGMLLVSVTYYLIAYIEYRFPSYIFGKWAKSILTPFRILFEFVKQLLLR